MLLHWGGLFCPCQQILQDAGTRPWSEKRRKEIAISSQHIFQSHLTPCTIQRQHFSSARITRTRMISAWWDPQAAEAYRTSPASVKSVEGPDRAPTLNADTPTRTYFNKPIRRLTSTFGAWISCMAPDTSFDQDVLDATRAAGTSCSPIEK